MERLSVNINDETAETIRRFTEKRGLNTTEATRWAFGLLAYHEAALEACEDKETLDDA